MSGMDLLINQSNFIVTINQVIFTVVGSFYQDGNKEGP